jgi:SPP1 gp7 family putative phage head morphogenesis protein
MPDSLDLNQLTGEYREELVRREDLARRSLLKNYRGAWRGLETSIDKTIGQLTFSDDESAQMKGAVLKSGEGEVPPLISADKIGQMADLLLRKRDWKDLEEKIDVHFEEVADAAADLTNTDRFDLETLAVTHAVKMLDHQLGDKKPQDEKKLKMLHKFVEANVQFLWIAKRERLQAIFRRAAGQVAERARRALRQEAITAILQRARASEILSRVKEAIDLRENYPEADPALVRTLRSEYRIATIESYRQGLLQTFKESGMVKQWRWTVERTSTTCAICLAMDGHIFSIDQPQRSHPNCRCTLAPLIDPGEDKNNEPVQVRADDGENQPVVPLTTPQPGATGNDTFAQLSLQQQLAVLGEKAFDAYQKGEFDLADLVGVQYSEKLGVETLYRKSVEDAVKAGEENSRRTAISEQLRIKQESRERIEQIKMARAEAAKFYEPLDIDFDIKYETALPDERQDVREGFSRDYYPIPLNIQFLKDEEDPRFDTFKTAALAYIKDFGIPESALDKLIIEWNITNDHSVRPTNRDSAYTKEEFKKVLNDEWDRIMREEKDKYKTKRKPKPYYFLLTADFRQRLYEIYVGDSGDPALQRSLALEKKLRAVEADLAKTEPTEPLAHAFWDLHRQIALKDAIRDFYENQKADFRSNANQAEIAANKTADSLEWFFNEAISMHPILGPLLSLSPSLKQRVVEFGIGVTNGGIELAGMAEGGEIFLMDTVVDLTVYALQKTGLSKVMGENFTALVAANEKMRKERAELFTAFSDMKTVHMGKENAAYLKIKELGIPTTPYDMPNWPALAGKMGVEALPYIALAFVTDGASLGVQIGAMTAASGSAAFNLTYVKTNDYSLAMKNGLMASAQAGVGGLTGRLPILGNLAADALTTYAFGKLSGQDDDAIFQQMILQGAISAGTQAAQRSFGKLMSRKSFSPGGEMNEQLLQLRNEGRPPGEQVAKLSFQEAQDLFMKLMDEHFKQGVEIAKQNTRTSYQLEAVTEKIVNPASKLNQGQKELFEAYGSKNTAVKKAEADRAKTDLENFVTQASKTNPKVDISTLPEVSRLAAFHVEELAGSFENFARVMRTYKGGKNLTLEQLEAIYKEAIQKVRAAKQNAKRPAEEIAKIEIDQEGINRLKEEAAQRLAAIEKAKAESLAGDKPDAKKPVKTGDKTADKPGVRKMPKQDKSQPTKEEQAAQDGKTYKNYEDVREFLDKEIDIPALKRKGYRVKFADDEIIIYRPKGGIEKGFAKLTIDGEGKVAIDRGGGSKRISNPTEMRNNFRNKLMESFGDAMDPPELKKFVDEMVRNFERHHIIPDNIVRKTELGILAQRAGYSLDNAGNLIGLVKDKALIGNKETVRGMETDLLDYNTGHWDYHPSYDKMVRARMKEAFEQLKTKYPGLEKIMSDPKAKLPENLKKQIIEDMKNIENEFRQKLKNGEVPTDADQRLSELERGDNGNEAFA